MLISAEEAYEEATEKGRFAGLLAAPPDELN